MGFSRFHEPPRELKSHLFVVLLDVSLREVNPHYVSLSYTSVSCIDWAGLGKGN